ncbi:MAG: glycosyltransferase family 4 protein, partial [Pseudomonadota bacterium]|nr:glycosyltransferase family 4 protein [Pseudomonadota bacterium]
QPSFRHRMQNLVVPLQSRGWDVRCEAFPGGRYGLRTWERRAAFAWADVVVLHQIKLSALEARLVAGLCRRTVFDVDDAIYVRKPRRLTDSPQESIWRRRKFAATCRWVDAVAAGNAVLASVAGATADDVVILPTSIDVGRYRPTTARPADPPTVAWIGSPENLIYLEMLRPALVRLRVRHPSLRLRVICSRFPQWPEFAVEPVPWSSASEADALAGAHVGVMPLTDDEWSRGKCAFKLLQYMAAALPCVASPVGANTEAVIDGVTGFHARSTEEWEDRLGRLLDSAPLRASCGANGLQHVSSRYSLEAYAASYAALLGRLAAR